MTVSAAPNSYTIVLPPGWGRVPLRSGTDGVVRRLVDQAFARYPRDQVGTLRRDYEQSLRKVIRQARDASGLDLLMPFGPMHGLPIAASVLVSEVSFTSVEQVAPEDIAVRLAAADGGEPVEVDGALAVRSERRERADPAKGVANASRRVDYLVAVPDDPDRWLALGFSTLCPEPSDGGQPAAGDMSGLLVELFDAMMTTFRWEHR